MDSSMRDRVGGDVDREAQRGRTLLGRVVVDPGILDAVPDVAVEGVEHEQAASLDHSEYPRGASIVLVDLGRARGKGARVAEDRVVEGKLGEGSLGVEPLHQLAEGLVHSEIVIGPEEPARIQVAPGGAVYCL